MSTSALTAVRLEQKISERLEILAKSTGRTKSFYIKKAIMQFLDEMEEAYIALDRVKKPSKRYTMEEAKRLLNVED
jgi:RHH-type transcriptional regulator, rel operon repressor / antitoxin RelB